MKPEQTARAVWGELSPKRDLVLRKAEKFASYTIPSVALPPGFNRESSEEQRDYQSVGAQATNHLVNKIMLASFAPSRPNFRLDLPSKEVAKMIQQGLIKNEDELALILADGERQATKYLDRTGQRVKLYQAIRHLVVAGNVLIDRSDKSQLRTMSLKHYCVERDVMGRVLRLVIQEKLPFTQLLPEVQEAVQANKKGPITGDVELYKLIVRKPAGNYYLCHYVDDLKLPKEFEGNYPTYDDMPYHPQVWELEDESDYGTGLVEHYAGAFFALSKMSESMVLAGILTSEFRYLVDSTGGLSASEFTRSVNGAVLPGREGDVQVVTGGDPRAVEQLRQLVDIYSRQIAQAFLLGSATTRDSERTTAEEIRMNANELETAFGGVYTSLGVQLQKMVAMWCLDGVGFSVKGTEIQVSIITGLDALSRNGDLEQLRVAFNYLNEAQNGNPEFVARLKWDEYAAYVQQGTGAPVTRFVMTAQEYEELLAARRQQDMQMEQQRIAAQAGAQAGASMATNQQGTTQ